MNYELFIALRYLKAHKKRGFISVISLISVLGVAVGVAALIVVLAVMSGFDQKLKEAIVSTNAHILVEAENGIAEPGALVAELTKMKHVVAASSYVNGQAMVAVGEDIRGVILRGIDPQKELEVTKIDKYLTTGQLVLNEADVIVGSEFAKFFNLRFGNTISVISPVSGKKFSLKISGIFTSGMYDYDLNLVFVNIRKAQEIFGMANAASGIGLKLDDEMKAEGIKFAIQRELGFPYWVRSWMDVNRNFFNALKLEKTTMFLILTLIVIVAALNIASTLVVMVTEKTKDIGILKAIGVKNFGITRIFTWTGFLIGAIGTALGACMGFLLCYLLATYKLIKLPADIYYIENLPCVVRPGDSALIIAAALLISLVATIYPAAVAARLNPVEALRYE